MDQEKGKRGGPREGKEGWTKRRERGVDQEKGKRGGPREGKEGWIKRRERGVN